MDNYQQTEEDETNRTYVHIPALPNIKGKKSPLKIGIGLDSADFKQEG